MSFPFDIDIHLNAANIANLTSKKIKIYKPITTLLGPNGAGKTQLLRGLKNSLTNHAANKKVRYISAGRLGPLESYRSNYDGQRGTPNFDRAQYLRPDELSYRHQNETITGDFGTLSERPDVLIKVQERLKTLFNRNIRIDWVGGYLKVYLSRNDINSSEYSSAREASGLLHLVGILTALYDDEVGVVLIDEPEVSLHPQLQAFLFQEINKVAGYPSTVGKKLICIATHSTEFIQLHSVEDLASIIFCEDIYKDPVQVDPNQGEFQNKKIKALLARMGQEHKLALFSARPLLVEGPSDQIICSGLSRLLDLNIEAGGSQILPVIGKGQMPVVTKLMRLIGKTPSVLVDADAFTDSSDLITIFLNDPIANAKAIEWGHKDGNTLGQNIYQAFTSQVQKDWTDLQTLAEQHSYWLNRDTTKEEKLAKQRATFCVLMSLEDFSSINNGMQWQRLKIRLQYLLNLLSSLGCFILTRGTIENYYRYADQLTKEEKPNASVNEIECLVDIAKAENQYQDVIVAIRYAAQTKSINESLAIRDLVLSVLAPALATLSSSTTDASLNSNSKNLLGKRADLFKLSIVNSDKPYIKVEINSKILEPQGFPLLIPKDADPIKAVNEQMGL